MVRINLTDYNEANVDRRLNFQNIGNLTSPLNADYVSVMRFSIPSGGIPLYYFEDDLTNSITLSYGAKSFTQDMILIDKGSGNWIFEVDHLVSMMNATFQTAVTGLNALISLPTLIPPCVVYDKLKSIFSIIVPKTYASTPIYIDFDNDMWRFFQGLPSIKLNGLQRLIISPGQNGEKLFQTNYIKLTQEASTISNWFNVRIIYITTSLPIEAEVLTSTSINTGQSASNILSSYILPVERGTLDNYTSMDFVAPKDRFRPCRINAKDIYNVKCDVYYQDVRGHRQIFNIGARSMATIELEFF